MVNLFERLGRSFGTEDFFTAALALFIERNADVRDQFLRWAEEAAGEPLRKYAWRIDIQRGLPSCAKTAVLDMCLCNEDIELWFEHKVGAALGNRTTKAGQEIDQVEKYLDAAARHMCGITDGEAALEWPVQGPSLGRPRVLLFYVSRSGAALDRIRYQGRLHAPGGSGLVLPKSGTHQWREFFSRAEIGFESALNDHQGEFERVLSRLFLDYWRSLPGMWSQQVYDASWTELIPKPVPTGERSPFAPFWDEIVAISREQLGWEKGDYLGEWLYLYPPTGPVDTITLNALQRIDEMQIPDSSLGDQVLQIQFKARDVVTGWTGAQTKLAFEKWKGVCVHEKSKGYSRLRMYVGVSGWTKCLTFEQQARAVTGTIIAGLKMFQQATGLLLPGVDRL